MKPLVLVSADSHVAGRPQDYRDYLPAAYRELLDELIDEVALLDAIPGVTSLLEPEMLEVMDERGTLAAGNRHACGWSLGHRLRELDAEGVAGEIVNPATLGGTTPFFHSINRPFPADVRAAGVRAYHRWVADMIADSGGRLFGSADPGPCTDMDATIEELRWVADHGFVAVHLPGVVGGTEIPPVYDRYYEPFWAACVEFGLVLQIHAGWGVPQGVMLDFLEAISKVDPTEALADNQVDEDNNPDSPVSILPAQRPWWQLMLSGVFDRHPNLKLALSEIRADWIPDTLAHLDKRAVESATPPTMKPSEYFAQNCAVIATFTHRAEIEMRHEIGIDQFIFGTDFPHVEGTWPNTQNWIRDAFREVPENDARKILGENAIDFFNLDRAALTKVAATIGPTATDVLGSDVEIDPKLIDLFDLRGGYLKPRKHIDRAEIDAKLDEDLAQLAATSDDR